MKIIAIAVLALSLTACASKPVLTGTQTVYVPVVTKCEPTLQITEVKEWPSSRITKDMSLFDKTKLILADRSILKGLLIEYKAALKECTK